MKKVSVKVVEQQKTKINVRKTVLKQLLKEKEMEIDIKHYLRGKYDNP